MERRLNHDGQSTVCKCYFKFVVAKGHGNRLVGCWFESPNWFCCCGHMINGLEHQTFPGRLPASPQISQIYPQKYKNTFPSHLPVGMLQMLVSIARLRASPVFLLSLHLVFEVPQVPNQFFMLHFSSYAYFLCYRCVYSRLYKPYSAV